MSELAVLISFSSVFLAVGMVLFSLKFRTAEKSLFFILLSFQVFLYIVGYLLEITSHDLSEALYATRVQYLGFPFILPNSYLFLRDIFGKKNISTWQAILLFIIPMVTITAMQSYPITNLFYQHVEYVSNGHFANALITPGPIYHLHTVYSYIITTLSFGLIFEAYFSHNTLVKKQSIPLLIGFSAPVIASVCYLLRLAPVQYDFTPLATALTILMLIYSANYQNLLQVVPLAKRQLIDSMEDGFIIFDEETHFIYANNAAKKIFHSLNDLQPGDKIEGIETYVKQTFFTRNIDGEERIYEISKVRQIEKLKNGGMYVTIHDATEKERLLQQLHNKAKYDYLTNIYNRGAFFERAEQIITSAQSGAIFIALLLDVDNFKAINDHYGHSCGDYVLKTLCGEIRNSMVPFPTSIFGRYGGEEFSFLFDTLTVEQVLTFAENFRERIANLAVEWQGQLIPFTISIGISSGMKTESFLLEELFLKADVALYQAKNNGKNCVILYKNEQNLEGFSSAN